MSTTAATNLTTPFTTAELEAVRNVLQNETAWDRDADTGGFNAYHSADNPERVLGQFCGGPRPRLRVLAVPNRRLTDKERSRASRGDTG